MKRLLLSFAVVLTGLLVAPTEARAQWGCPKCGGSDMFGTYCTLETSSHTAACSTGWYNGYSYCTTQPMAPGTTCYAYEEETLLAHGVLARLQQPFAPGSGRWTTLREGIEALAACNGAAIEMRYSAERAGAIRAELETIVLS